MENDSHVLELIPAYALDCLDEAETQVVKAHLASCAQCQAELSIYQELAGQMAYAVPQVDPPLGVRAAILARLPAASIPQTRKSWWQSLQESFARLSPAWAVASLALIGFLVISNLFLWDQVRELGARRDEPMAVVALNGTEFAPESSGMIVISRDGLYGTLVVDHLPVLDESQQYQLWLTRDGQRTSGGVFTVSDHGYGSMEIESSQPLGSYGAFGITIEPAGGSPGPTGDKVLGGDL
jgi:anti-sigma-K factor RskA